MAVTLDAATVDDIVNRLELARTTKIQIRQVTLEHPDMTIDDAYAIQRAWIDRQLASGKKVVGHKIGLTSRAMQQAVGIDEPDFGTLLDSMVYEPDADIPFDDFVEPRLEVELAYVLSGSLEGVGITADDVLAATAYVAPAVEIIDARIQRIDPSSGRTRSVRDTIADNAANAGIILGGHRIDPSTCDLRWAGAILTQNGVVEETGLGAGVLGNPTLGVVWLARKYAQFGLALTPGQLILAGSFTRPVFVSRGDEFVFDYGDLGRFGARFT